MDNQEDPEMETAVRVFAHYLGVDLETEADLIPAVKDAFFNLPEDWDIGIGEDEQAGIPFFFNVVTGVSDWKHPREDMCIEVVRVAREKKEARENERKRQAERNRNTREGDQNRRSNNNTAGNGRNAKPEVSDVVSMEDVVEDLEDIPSTRGNNASKNQQAQQTRNNVRDRSASPTQVHEVKARGVSQNANKGGFGMSSDDFLDEDDLMPNRGNNSGPAGATAQRGAVDHSMSPPLFKEMRNERTQKAADYDSDDARNMRSKLGTARDGDRSTSLINSNTAVSDGAVTSGWASALGAAQTGTDRDRERERNASNQRGRNVGDGDDHRGGGGGGGRGGGRGDDRGGRGAGDRAGDRGRDQSRDNPWDRRDTSRDGRDGRDRDARDNYRDNNRDTRDTRDTRSSRDDEGRFARDGRDNNRERDYSRDGRSERDRAGSNQRGSVAFQGVSAGVSSSSSAGVVGSNHVSDKERELRAELDKYQVDVRKLGDDNLELAEKLALQRTKHANELSALREDAARLELRLAEERRERKVVEEQLTHAHAEHHSKARDLEDVHEIRLREAVRKARTDTEEEYREKVRTAERRGVEELDAVRAELLQLKRKYEEVQREADNAKRKVTLSKADGKLEAQAEIDALRVTLREAEENDRKQSLEMRRLREESAAVQGRLVGALQAVQLANAECDALRATAHTAVHDEQTHSGAVQAAMQRIQILDTECAQVKAENIILRREKEASALEMRKLKGTASFSGERLSTTESEARRIKAQAQAETGRLQSRVTELEALTSVLRGQLDQAASHEAQAVREVSREYDTLDSEVLRLRDRLADREVKEEALSGRIKAHEREIIRLQETIFKKDRQIRDEQEGKEGIQAQIESIRRGYEAEAEDLKAALTKQKQANAELAIQQRRESERLEAEIAEKVPELIASAVSRVEAQWVARHAKELADMKLQYDHQRDKLRAENHDLHALFSEKEARQRLQSTDEKIELEKLRQNTKTLQRRNEDLEEQIQELRRQLRAASNNSHYFGGATPGTAQSRGRQPPGRFPNASFNGNPSGRQSLDFSNMLEQSFENVRHSTGSFMPPYDPRFDNSHTNNENVYDAQAVNAMQLQAGEDELASHTVSFITDQLAFMKKQISSALANDAAPVTGPRRHAHSAHNGQGRGSQESALVRADDAIEAIDQSVLDLPSSASGTHVRTPAVGSAGHTSRSATVPSSILSQHHHHHHPSGGPAHHVKFSPEALFHSPQHNSRASAGANAGAKNRAENTATSNSNVHSNLHHASEETSARHAEYPDTESAEYDIQQEAPRTSNNINMRDLPMDSSMISDYSLNNISSSYYDNPASVNSAYNMYTTNMNSSRGSVRSGAASSGVFGGLGGADFSAISDGGYHEGYWRTKYQRTNKQ